MFGAQGTRWGDDKLVLGGSITHILALAVPEGRVLPSAADVLGSPAALAGLSPEQAMAAARARLDAPSWHAWLLANEAGLLCHAVLDQANGRPVCCGGLESCRLVKAGLQKRAEEIRVASQVCGCLGTGRGGSW
jgi:hypothetical protein